MGLPEWPPLDLDAATFLGAHCASIFADNLKVVRFKFAIGDPLQVFVIDLFLDLLPLITAYLTSDRAVEMTVSVYCLGDLRR